MTKVLLTLLISPVLGFAAGFVLHRVTRLLLRGATPRINRHLRHGQWLAAAALAFSHGTNDAQKGMGIITLVLVLMGQLEQFVVPFWVMLVSALTMTVGTAVGGWRIVKTVGFGIYRLRLLHGLNVETASAAVIFGSSLPTSANADSKASPAAAELPIGNIAPRLCQREMTVTVVGWSTLQLLSR